MPKTELHKLAETDRINEHNIGLHINDINTVDEGKYNYERSFRWSWGDGHYGENVTPLHVALIKISRASVLYLISAGADINLTFI